LMTTAIVLDQIKSGKISLETEFEVSEKAWRTKGSKMFVLVKTKIKVEDLLKGIIVQSGNDACIVVAENIGGSIEGFVKIMNDKAQEWGLDQSSFTNPNGLPDPDQLMSAYDLAKLTRKIIRDYPDQFAMFSLPEFTWSKITQQNRNPLLKSFDGADGMKTGYTELSGYGIVGTAFKDQQRRIIVLNGLETHSARTREATRVMELAFSQFDTRKYFSSGQKIAQADIFMGRSPSVDLEIRNDVTFTLHVKPLNKIAAHIIYQGPLRAPLTKGDQVAVLRVTMPGQPVHEYPLYAAEDVREIGMFGKIRAGLTSLLTPPNAEDV
ncbi:MAG: D-alanyl-D-alanine carboxypeptidase family protein, partial [Parvularculaceae bacterium]